MRYLLDSDVCIDFLRGTDSRLTERIQEAGPDNLCTSVIVAAELRYGASRSRRARRNHETLDRLFEELTCYELPTDAAIEYGRLRTRLEKRGHVIGPNDMLIAAHALALDLTLVSANEREFSKVKGLTTENWRSK